MIDMRGREPRFIGGAEGALWKMLPLLMEGTKLTSNQPQDAVNLAVHLRNRPCNVDGRQPAKIQPERSHPGYDCTATGPSQPDFCLVGL
jgi:hypothetical protein